MEERGKKYYEAYDDRYKRVCAGHGGGREAFEQRYRRIALEVSPEKT